MKSTVTLCENALDPSTWETFEDVEDVREFLVNHFGIWPESARIYLDHVANNADITPFDEAGIDRLGRVHGHFYVVVYPAIPLAFAIIAIVMAAMAIVLTFLLRPHSPAQDEKSANNLLGNRQNQARPGERIPDIFGQLWATFDLLSAPYRTFVNNIEIEHCYMCIGRGSYDIASVAGDLQVCDDIIPLAQINGASAGIYGPGTSPNSGGSPLATIGAPISEPVANIKELSFVNGQVLATPNLDAVWGSRTKMRFEYPNIIRNDGSFDFRKRFNHLGGDFVTVGGMVTDDDLAVDPDGTTNGQNITVTIAGGSPYDGLRVILSVGQGYIPGHDSTLCYFKFAVPTSSSYGPTRTNGSTYQETGYGFYSGMEPLGLIFMQQGNIVTCWYNHYGDPPDPQLMGDVAGASGVHLNGTYTSTACTADTITLYSPVTINPNWAAVAAFDGGLGISKWWPIDLMANGNFQVGPFTVLNTAITELWFNFLCAQGCYEITKKGHQYGLTDTIQVGIAPCDATGAKTGPEQFYTCTITGNNVDKQYKGTTLKVVLPAGFASAGGVIVRAKRTNFADTSSGVNVVDEVQWKNCYMVWPVTQSDFGDVTTIQTIMIPTPNALAVKERKMNALVTRKIPALVGGVFTGLVGSKNAADILCAMALDPHIGNRALAELDVAGIYAVAGPGGEIETYFAALAIPSQQTEFCYTFDDTKTSFEESVGDIALALNCVAYRRGSVLTLSFEKNTPNSTLLFNHRNKVPGSETKAFTFGTPTDNDGINVDYIEPNTPTEMPTNASGYANRDSTETLFYPLDKSAVNPKKVTLLGVRNIQQANVIGWRLFQKLLNQNTIVQFDATEEAALLVLQDRILVADNTRSDTQDGEVVAQASLLLTLSQKVIFDGVHNYTIFLQMPDETVESIDITAGPTDHQVVLASAPSIPCIVDSGNFAKTTYQVVSDKPTRTNAFLLAEKNPKDGKLYELKAVNYDDAYYLFDHIPPGIPPPSSPPPPGSVIWWPITGPVTLYNPLIQVGSGLVSGSGTKIKLKRMVYAGVVYDVPTATWNAPICAVPPNTAKIIKIYLVAKAKDFGTSGIPTPFGLPQFQSPTYAGVMETFPSIPFDGTFSTLISPSSYFLDPTTFPWTLVDMRMDLAASLLWYGLDEFDLTDAGFLICYAP
jgi:hypothetical protein